MSAARPLPDFLIIGAMKSATSTLHEQLARQPGIFMSTPKEPNFFSDDDVYARGLDWYFALFQPGVDARLRGESSTHYTKLPTHPHTLERMQRQLGAPKLIYVMRHPIDRLISHYMHEWSQRVFDVPIDDAVDRHPELIDYGRYAMQLRPYFDAYGPQQVLPVFFDRLATAPEQELERVCRFLGFPGKPTWYRDMGAQNVSKERLRLGPLARFVRDNPLLTRLRRTLLPTTLRERLKSPFRMRRRPELSPATLDRVRSRFDADLAELGALLGTPLDCENFRQVTAERSLEWVDNVNDLL